jgi:predicted enzyme related to lactoylglutathione lyase
MSAKEIVRQPHRRHHAQEVVMTAEVTLSQIGQISVSVTDVERATAFYRDRLGLRHLFTAAPGLSFFDCGGVRLMLSRPEGPSHGTSVLYFRVSDIREAHRSLAGRGVRFHDAPHLIAQMDTYDLWMAFFYDSEGNMLAIMSEVPKP